MLDSGPPMPLLPAWPVYRKDRRVLGAGLKASRCLLWSGRVSAQTLNLHPQSVFPFATNLPHWLAEDGIENFDSRA